jgi:hypothetical protein
VNLDERHLSRAFKQPHVRDHIEDRTRSFLSEGKLVAGARLLELVHAKSEHVSLDAARHLLAVNGIAPPTDGGGLNININNNSVVAGYVVDMTPWQPISAEERRAAVAKPVNAEISEPAATPALEDAPDVRPVGPQLAWDKRS